MNEKFSLRLLNSCSDNPKSKIQNLKWGGVVAIGVAFALFGVAAHAQQASVPRVGVIHLGGPFSTMIDGLRNGLRELGLQEGKQFVLEVQDLGGEIGRAHV